MSDPKVSNEIRKFLRANIESIGTLEVLAVFLNDKNRAWTAEDLRVAVHSSTQAIELHLKQLLKMRAIARDAGTFKYAPYDENLAKLLSDLNVAYVAFPKRIIEMIYNRTDQTIRDFSDAFKIRNDPDDD